MNFLFVFGSLFLSSLPSLYTPKSFEQSLHLKSTFTTNLFQFLFLFWWIPVIYFPKQNKTHKVKHNNLHQTLQNQRKTNSKTSNEKDLNPRAPSFGINNWVLSLLLLHALFKARPKGGSHGLFQKGSEFLSFLSWI